MNHKYDPSTASAFSFNSDPATEVTDQKEQRNRAAKGGALKFLRIRVICGAV